MTKNFNLKHENSSTPSISIVEAYRKVVVFDDFEESLSLVHYLGGKEEFRLDELYTKSGDPLDRAVGADILGQLGWQDRTYLQDSLKILTSLFDDSDEYVIFCACCTIGHRGDEKSINQLIKHLIWVSEHNVEETDQIEISFVDSVSTSFSGKTIEELHPNQTPSCDESSMEKLFEEFSMQKRIREKVKIELILPSGERKNYRTTLNDFCFHCSTMWKWKYPEEARMWVTSNSLSGIEKRETGTKHIDIRMQYNETIKLREGT